MHDQSFPGLSGLSVNQCVRKEDLPPCMYSFVLQWALHYISDIRRRHPKTKIYLYKFDLDAAYRRCHLSGSTATECLVVYDNILLVALRMTFGGSPCPSLREYISDTITDTCKALIHNDAWDHKLLYDDISSSIETPNSLLDSIPFHEAKELALSIPTTNLGIFQIFMTLMIT